MPASSRLTDLFGVSSPLRQVPLMSASVPSDGWQEIWANGMFGGYLTAVADPGNARVRVDLYWPDVITAVIERVHADGTTYQVRGGDPATMCTAWARWDYECPLDQEVTYQAVSSERDGAVTVTGPVTLTSSGRHWLKSVSKPSLNLAVTVRDRGTRQQPPRAGKVEPPLRPDPIYVYQVRASDKGSIALYAADQATETTIRAMLADGGPLILQYPAAAGGESLWLMADIVGYNPVSRITVDLQREIQLPFDVIGRPDGAALGDPDSSYTKVSDTYQTYNQVAAAAASYLELSMLSL
jgi:hypothetical protein